MAASLGTAMPPDAAPPANDQSVPDKPAGSVDMQIMVSTVKAAGRSGKRQQKKNASSQHKCVNYFVDALDTKMLWAEAKIIAFDSLHRIKVHFMGWHKRFDIWTDVMSIAPHGYYVPLKGGAGARSWDGNMSLFSDPADPSAESATPTMWQPSVQMQTNVGAPRAAPVIETIEPPVPKAKEIRKKSDVSKENVVNGSTVGAEYAKVPSNGRRLQRAAIAARAPIVPKTPRQSSPRAEPVERPLKRPRLVLKPVGSVTVDYNAVRQKNVEEANANNAFLTKCAEIWSRQLHVLAVQPS